MGLNGTILVFPKAGSPPPAPDPIARRAIAVFENYDLLHPNTANQCETPKPWIGMFAEHRENGDLATDEYALYIVRPEQIAPKMRELVYLLDVDADGQQSPIELPFIEFSVATKPFPIINGYDGRTLCTTWAVVAFSYEDAGYVEEIHRIRNDKHPIFDALSEVFSSPISWDVQIG